MKQKVVLVDVGDWLVGKVDELATKRGEKPPSQWTEEEFLAHLKMMERKEKNLALTGKYE